MYTVLTPLNCCKIAMVLNNDGFLGIFMGMLWQCITYFHPGPFPLICSRQHQLLT